MVLLMLLRRMPEYETDLRDRRWTEKAKRPAAAGTAPEQGHTAPERFGWD